MTSNAAFYLETNALYSIRNISRAAKSCVFTSVFAIYEIVSGIKDEDTFRKRKNLLRYIFESEIMIDWEMPERIIWNSFQASAEYDFEEHRVNALKIIIEKIFRCSTYFEFITSSSDDSPFDFPFFQGMDKAWSDNFIKSTVDGNVEIHEILRNQENVLEINGSVLEIKTMSDLTGLMKENENLNSSITILSIANTVKKMGIDLDEDVIYQSYNGNIDNYVFTISDYCLKKLINFNQPAINDSSDLTHMLYLRNFNECKIVSNDKIYKYCACDLFITVDEFLNECV